ncbi:N-alpha-acetyltransferase 35, NatC auxiliary subunit isoform X2 [Cynara cardunculus var. scolymus]|uniref:N-alpha-acetyltransferase 35, NatC auxiliary subunit isoform X2 n=1 Tax=Cynara cardunculus var. scolymus TaxID=59895 RepID=UPI000D62CA27|nr:N-alpha-acetyltransferase 35, NatC auxiliary subunit isoform X2 [Cynara cardunculus var. scolymus]
MELKNKNPLTKKQRMYLFLIHQYHPVSRQFGPTFRPFSIRLVMIFEMGSSFMERILIFLQPCLLWRYYSVDEAIEDGAAPIPLSLNKTVDVHCIIDVMDHLLSCEATWHKGHSLAQTIFSCIYLLRPERTPSHALLHSYCTVIRSTCNAIISAVSDARTHEEEDLFTITSGLPLKKDGDEKCLSLLNVIEETVSRQLHACKAPSHKKRAIEDIEPLQTNLDLEEGYCKAVLCRLRFRKHFYHVLVCLRRPQGRGLDLARKHIASCLVELQSILKTAEFLRSNSRYGMCEDGMEDSMTASGCQPIGFDSTLNSRLSAPTPPRAIKILSWKKAVEYFQKLLHDLEAICSHPLDPSFEGVLRFVVEFQKLQPDLVARSHLQLLLVQDGKLYGRDPIFDVICKAAAVPEITKIHDIQKNESFVHLGQLVITLLKILCTNAAWQRRQLGKVLQDWRIIHMQLELALRKEFEESSSTSIDENLCMKIYKHVLNWVEEQTYWIAFRFLILGFELELYSPSEYCMVYWYLYVVLIKLGEKMHFRMITSTETGKRKGKKKKESVKDVARDQSIPPAVLLLQCHIYLAEGLTLMIAALRNEHGSFQCQGPFNTEQERFIQHFELLQRASIPDHISYYSFRDYTTHAQFDSLVMCNYFKEAQRIAKELRSSFSNDANKLAELRHIEQVAEHNGIALNLVSQLGSLDPSLKVSFEFNHHPHFATAVVKRS